MTIRSSRIPHPPGGRIFLIHHWALMALGFSGAAVLGVLDFLDRTQARPLQFICTRTRLIADLEALAELIKLGWVVRQEETVWGQRNLQTRHYYALRADAVAEFLAREGISGVPEQGSGKALKRDLPGSQNRDATSKHEDVEKEAEVTAAAKTFSRRPSGIACWLPDDREKARQIEQAQLQQQRALLREFEAARQEGPTGERRKRASKRQALHGLPGDWREHLYQRAAKGKYADAILVTALTGCRPEELRRGVLIRRVDNPLSGMDEIKFEIGGAKVKTHQGQPHRVIVYRADDPHPLLKALRARLTGQGELLIRIDSPVNFTVEVRRLARSLWPKHKHAITAYCLRHQWAADMKRHTAVCNLFWRGTCLEAGSASTHGRHHVDGFHHDG